jgi:hypothetical protein
MWAADLVVAAIATTEHETAAFAVSAVVAGILVSGHVCYER